MRRSRHPDAQLLIEEVQEEYVVRYGGRDETPIDPLSSSRRAGAFFVGYLDDVPGRLRGVAPPRRRRGRSARPNTAEIKRMYVAPGRARPRAGPRRMLAHLEATAAGGRGAR